MKFAIDLSYYFFNVSLTRWNTSSSILGDIIPVSNLIFGVKNVSSGMKVIILTVVISGVAAVLFPLPDEEKEEEEADHEA